MTRRRLGWLSVLAGGALALAAQVAAPVGVPLYDGVVVQEPYRFLDPTGSQPGNPTSFSAEPDVVGGESPTIIAATTESPPQAQFIAQVGAFQVPTGTSALRVTIEAVEPPAVPAPGVIVGNVYRFSVTGQGGAALNLRACEGCASLVMRAPEGTAEATLARFAGGSWTVLPTNHAGMVAMYSTNPPALGDYAVIVTVPTDGGDGLFANPLLLIGIGAGLVLGLAVLGLILLRRQSRPAPVATPRRDAGAAVPGRVPSKRRRPRPPSEGPRA